MMGGTEAFYREVVLDHHRNPLGREPLARVDAEARGTNPNCGDDVVLRLQQEDGAIVGIHAEARGCAISTASASILAGAVRGLSAAEALALVQRFRRLLRDGSEEGDEGNRSSRANLGDVEALLGVRAFPLRVRCAMLPWAALEQALTHPGQAPPGVTTDG